MRGKELLDKMGNIDPAYIKAAEEAGKRKKSFSVRKLALAAACLCIAAGAIFAAAGSRSRVQNWSPSFAAEKYFKNSDDDAPASAKMLADADLPFAETRSFSDERTALEEEGVIPVIESHPQFNANAHYGSEGELVSVTLSWHRRDLKGLEHYSDLSVTAGLEEVPMVSDCIYIVLDEKGNVIPPGETVTKRDGVYITAVGGEGQNKTMTYKNDMGWYQIAGSWNDSYADVVFLLDWFWDHPIDFSRFPIERGDEYTYCTLSEAPDAFEGMIPHMESLGFVCESSVVSLKNGEPESAEIQWIGGVTEEQAKNGEYRIGENGCRSFSWSVQSAPDFYDIEGCIGSLEELTEEMVSGLEAPDRVTTQTRVQFSMDGSVITIYTSDLGLAWDVISSLR